MSEQLWGHRCADGAGMAIAKGEACAWCAAREPEIDPRFAAAHYQHDLYPIGYTPKDEGTA